MSKEIYVLGISMTNFGNHLNKSVKELTSRAVTDALKDAEIDLKDIEGAFYGNTTQGMLEGQHLIRGPVALRDMGFEEIPIVTVENACASGSTAFNLAVQFLKAGEGDIALAVGADKMITRNKSKTMKVFDSAWDIYDVENSKNRLMELGEGLTIPKNTTSEKPYSIFMDIYASFGRFHMKTFGSTQEEFAAVSAKNHNHSVHNNKAQYQKQFTIDEILAAPPITYPLTLPMCSPISDGAAAVILCTKDAFKKRGLSKSRAIKVLSTVLQTGSNRSPDETTEHLTVKASQKAYEKAGVGPDDISVAEVHDATAIGEVIQIENLGLVEFGDGGKAALRGDTIIGGKIPVNPSGGLESKGHPLSATGIAQIYELVTQLRGEAKKRQVNNARVAIAENGGGLYQYEEAVCNITILSK